MFSRRHITLLGAGAAAAVALALPTGAQAAPQVCAANLPGPAGQAWVIQQNGALRQSIHFGGGSAFDAEQGQLSVNGIQYASVPNDPPKCVATSTSLTFPSQSISGLFVGRSVSSTGGLLRHLDTITNPGNVQKVVTVDFGIEVLGSQDSVKSESGNTTVNSDDHWAVLKSSNAFPFLRWGQDSGLEPAVQSDDPDSPNLWQPKVGAMPDANLHYTQVVVGAGQTVRLLHTTGAATSQQSAVDSANNTAAPFSGYSKTVAKQIINWGPDPDLDGVSAFNDDCPGIKGNQPNGCLLGEPPPPVDPVDPGDPNPNPQPQPDPGQSDPAPIPGNPLPPVKDTTAPKLTFKKLVKSAKASALTGKGIAPQIRCDETCTITIRVQVQRKGKKKAGTVLTVKSGGISSANRKFTLKLKKSSLKKLAKQRLTLVITAVDAAGNKRTVTKLVALKK